MEPPASHQPAYLAPYLSAARRHGGGFATLLWASQETQYARFEAFAGLVTFAGRNVLDVGCGRADLLEFLKLTGRAPKEFIGIEGVPELAAAAEATVTSAGAGVTGSTRIIRKDFVAEPACMFTCSDVVAISGSLNTAPDEVFYRSLKRAYEATAHDLVFNFLSSSELAGAPHLFWRQPEAVERFCRNVLGASPKRAPKYLGGDATFLLRKPVT